MDKEVHTGALIPGLCLVIAAHTFYFVIFFLYYNHICLSFGRVSVFAMTFYFRLISLNVALVYVL